MGAGGDVLEDHMKVSTKTKRIVLILAIAVVGGLFLSIGLVNRMAGKSVWAPVIIPPAPGRVPTLFIVGDSTAHYSDRRGWADRVSVYFDPNLVTVANRALAGRSSRSYQEEGAWDRVLAELQPGDFVIFQFGHNDSSRLDKRPDRATLPDIGKRTRNVKLPSGETRIVHTFGWYMTKYVAEAKAKGANPIVLSLTLRNYWKKGKIERDPEEYGKWASEIAESENVTFIDLNSIIADKYDRLGEEQVKAFFPEDDVHTSKEGAQLNAGLVVSGLKTLKDFPLCKCLSAKGRAIDAHIVVRAN
jgi:lysophospholipase L1-like esterase